MADMIGRQAAIDAVIKHLQLDYENAWGVREAINALPSAQPEVIYCKDCKYSCIFEPWDGDNATRYCRELRSGYARDSDLCVNDDDFCSRAERGKDG